jgi:hypothetical protein
MIKITVSCKIAYQLILNVLLSFILIACSFPSHQQVLLDSNENQLFSAELIDQMILKKSLYLKVNPPTNYEDLNAIEVHFLSKNDENPLFKDTSFKFEKFKQVLMRFSRLDDNLEEVLVDVKGFLKIKPYVLTPAQYDLDPFSSKQLLFQYPINLQISNTGIDFNLDYVVHVQPQNLPPYRFQAEVLYALNKEDEGVANQAFLESKYLNSQKRLPPLKSVQLQFQNQDDAFTQNLKGISIAGIQNQQVVTNTPISDVNGLVEFSIFEDHLLYQKNQNFDLKIKSARDGLEVEWQQNNQNETFWATQGPLIYQLPLAEKLDQNLEQIQIQAYGINQNGLLENLQAWHFKLRQTYLLRSDQALETESTAHIQQIDFFQNFYLNHPTLDIQSFNGDQTNNSTIQLALGNLDDPTYFEKTLRFPSRLSPDDPRAALWLEKRQLEVIPPVYSPYQSKIIEFDANQSFPYLLDLRTFALKPIIQGKILDLQTYGTHGIALEIRALSENQEGTFDVFYPQILQNGQFNQALSPGEYVVIASQQNEKIISAPYIGYFKVKAEQKELLLLKEFALLPAQIWRNHAVYLHDALVEYLENIYTEMYCDLGDIRLLNPETNIDLNQKIRIFSTLSQDAQIIDLPVHENLCEIEALTTF